MVLAQEEFSKTHYRTQTARHSPAADTAAWWDDLRENVDLVLLKGQPPHPHPHSPPTSRTLQRSNKLVDLLDAPLARITGQEHGIDAL